MDFNMDSTSVAISSIGGAFLAGAFYLRKLSTAWKAEGLEAAKVDSQVEVVEMLMEQIQELRRMNKEQAKEHREQIEESNRIIAELSARVRQFQRVEENLTEENRTMKREINRLTTKLDEFYAKFSQDAWDGQTERRK